MLTVKHNVIVRNEKFGTILNENFVDQTQFKLFLKAIKGCIELKNDFTFFNGNEFLVHIPNRILLDSVITTSLESVGTIDVVKSKIESLVTK